MAEKINLNKGYAPYNFIDFPKKVLKRYESYKDLPRHDTFVEGTLQGNIAYEIELETPTIVCKGSKVKGDNKETKEFCKNALGEYIIPGATLKGLLRNNVAILGQGIVGDYIENQRFLYRSVADRSGRLRKDYASRMGLKIHRDPKTGKSYSTLEHVKAGYIYKVKDKEYRIIPAKEIKGKSYFRINEAVIKKEKMPVHKMQFLDEGRNNYEPYVIPIQYDVNEQGKHIKYICDMQKTLRCRYQGYLLGSGFMNGKHAHYIINEVNEEVEEIKITQDEMRAYQYDVDKNANIRKSNFYHLPTEIGKHNMQPIFYIRYNQTTYFGYTPSLRLFYDHNIYEGMPEEQLDSNIMDYTRSLFGFADLKIGKDKEAISYKTRIQVEDAIAEEVVEDKVYQMVLGEPKATCLPHYLKQEYYDKERLTSYNDDQFGIRGIKCYWLKDDAKPESTGKSKQDINVKPLKKGTKFKGNISFNNLHPDELGLLLWSLSLEFGSKSAYHNIGLAKSYGFGRISIRNVKLNVTDVHKKYSNFSTIYEEEKDYKQYIQAYKAYVAQNFGVDVDNLRQIQEFMIIKTSVVSSRQTEFQYMSLDEFKCKAVLPSITEIKESNFKYVKKDVEPEKNRKNVKKYSNNRSNKPTRENQRRTFFGEEEHGNDIFDFSKLNKNK